MKKYIMLIIMMILSVSCLKNNKSSTSSLVASLDNGLYYYKLCSNEYVCKFQCEEGIEIFDLTDQNVAYHCDKLVAEANKNVLSDFSKEIQTKVIKPITNANAFTKITVDYTLLKAFDQTFTFFSQPIRIPAEGIPAEGIPAEGIPAEGIPAGEDVAYGTSTEKDGKSYVAVPEEIEHCYSFCKDSAGVSPNRWRTVKQDDEIIFQNYTSKELGGIQWTKIIGKEKMTYKEAVEACKNYKFRYDNWSLPDSNYLQLAARYQLADIIEDQQGIKLSFNDFVWSKTSGVATPLKTESYDEKVQVPVENYESNKKLYVICARKYEG